MLTQAPKGTQDVLPQDSYRWQRIEDSVRVHPFRWYLDTLAGALLNMETADLIKFAKFTAPDEYNAKVVPTAVRFVTETYQNALEEEPEGDVL